MGRCSQASRGSGIPSAMAKLCLLSNVPQELPNSYGYLQAWKVLAQEEIGDGCPLMAHLE